MPQAWPTLGLLISPFLGEEDDLSFWSCAIKTVFADMEYLCAYNPESKFVSARVGRCSHWLRPHQTSWRADGGFAWPTGYGGVGYSRSGFPLYDKGKSVLAYWDARSTTWTTTDPRKRFKPHQELRFYMAAPSRTARHSQAAVYTKWEPGPPPSPRTELVQFYGFRNNGQWECTAETGPEAVYDLVAENT